ncbi:variant erythrocyte surface antigen-1 family protein [Babesia caballi]|uniref:Variant erythrocyte surface antigen-1 family protein n=1 Tax=Babesia caballi TaxID=5871 RepID=A0AAV4LWM1_BABCB|nr:variant erythrocyte surface antigen-1 family protein [Babesia caballi]
MTASEKLLTQPPRDLKEAIDWVLRVSGGDFHAGHDVDRLATAVTASLKKTLHGENDNVKKIMAEITKDVNTNPTGPIKQLADGLKAFIGYNYENTQPQQRKITGEGIVTMGSYTSPGQYSTYTSAYKGSWFADVRKGSHEQLTDEEITCARIFFAAIQFIYEGLTELYLKCKTEWAGHQLSGNSNALNQFMAQNGFSGTQLNRSMKGDEITSQAFRALNEFSKAYNAAGHNPSLDAFRSQLEQNASTSPSTFPLSALYILATYAYVQSTSPATPSFLSYSGLTALAGGAYGINLGGLGTFTSALLA